MAPRALRMLKRLKAIAGCLALGWALLAAGAEPGPAPGSPAPDFELRDTAGKKVRLSSFKGSVVILHFWATWCPHCLKEMPLLESLGREKAFQSVRILAINLGEPRRKVTRYLQSHHLDLRVLLDSRGNVAQSYGVLGLPASVVVDEAGRVVERISMGSLDLKRLEETLAPLTEGKREGTGDGSDQEVR